MMVALARVNPKWSDLIIVLPLLRDWVTGQVSRSWQIWEQAMVGLVLKSGPLEPHVTATRWSLPLQALRDFSF